MTVLHDLDLIIRAKTDPGAREVLIVGSQGFIRDKIQRWMGGLDRLARRHRCEPTDLMQVGNVGLIQAIYAFGINRGSFIGFASVCIGNELRQFMRTNLSLVHIPRRTVEAIIAGEAELPVIRSLDAVDEQCYSPDDNTWQIDIEKALSKIHPLAYTVVSMQSAGFVQREIGEHVGLTQGGVSYVQTKIRKALDWSEVA